ncbi:hypothetical protein HMPREF9141_2330 [Prevotella multiformis DSM 16608]|uniref:Uncharacterized protein n=1 Tax=Prevotella multiformis DSM 16608 TaxID=888743 RepID=F0F9R3_9BACT|nr:hypothetical protein HMPREF9141_2330 [Prevotella multiformis DSM 16608]
MRHPPEGGAIAGQCAGHRPQTAPPRTGKDPSGTQKRVPEGSFFMVLPLNAQMGNGIKAHALAGWDYPRSDGLTKEDRLQDKMQKRQIDTMSVHQHVFPSFTDIQWRL